MGEFVQTVNEGIATKLPKLDSLKRTIQRQRIQTAPVKPTTLEQLIIPEEFMRTSKAELFLLHDSGPEIQRILIFATQKNLDMMHFSRVWLADGTFKTAPLLFTQVYVIHALRGGPDLLKDGHLLPSIFIYFPTNWKQHIKECGNRCSFYVRNPT